MNLSGAASGGRPLISLAGFLLGLVLIILVGSASPAWADSWDKVLGASLCCPASRVDIWPAMEAQWHRVQEMEKQNPAFSYPGQARLPEPYIGFWRNLMQKIPAMSSLQQLRAISGFVNVQLNGKPDQISYGLGEYWASPGEFIKNHGGDCEDFAITKYFALRAIGFKAEDLRLLVVEVPSRHSWHALLAASIEGRIYIVDNNFRPKDLALPHERLIGFFILHFAFNEQGAWFYRNP